MTCVRGSSCWVSGQQLLVCPSEAVGRASMQRLFAPVQEGQAAPGDARDLRAELLEKERKHFLKTKSTDFEEEREEDLRLLNAPPPGPGGSGDTADGGGGAREAARPLVPRAADADEEDDDGASSDDSDDDEVRAGACCSCRTAPVFRCAC